MTLFGPAHLLWLAILVAILAVVMRVFSAAKTETARRRILMAAAWAVIITHFAESFGRMAAGTYGIGTLPLHVCAFAAFASFIHFYLPKEWLSELLFFPFLPGAVLACVTPDWLDEPPFSFISAIGFLAHGAIILYVLLRIKDGTICPSWKKIWIPAGFLIGYALVMVPFDRHFRVNYGFLITPVPGTPLVLIRNLFGEGFGYLAGYAIFAFALMGLYYAVFLFIKHRRASGGRMV